MCIRYVRSNYRNKHLIGYRLIGSVSVPICITVKPVLSGHSKIDKVSKGAKIRNLYNQVPHLTQDTNGKVTNSQ